MKRFWILVFFILGGCTAVQLPKPNEPPQAAFAATPPEGEVPLVVQFDASQSQDPDGEITEYRWDFGDATTGEGVIVSHTYAAVGSYQVQLTIVDDRGAQDTAERTITALAKAPPLPVQLKDTSENEYLVLERTYPSWAPAGASISIEVKATAKMALPSVLLIEEPSRGLLLVEGFLRGGGIQIARGDSVRLAYTVTADQEGTHEIRGRAVVVREDGTPAELLLTTKLRVVKP